MSLSFTLGRIAVTKQQQPPSGKDMGRKAAWNTITIMEDNREIPKKSDHCTPGNLLKQN